MVIIVYKLVQEGSDIVNTSEPISIRYYSSIATLVGQIEQRHRVLMPNFTIRQVYQGGNELNADTRVDTIIDFNDNDELGTILEVRYCKFIHVFIMFYMILADPDASMVDFITPVDLLTKPVDESRLTIWVSNRSNMDELSFKVTVNGNCDIDSLIDAIIQKRDGRNMPKVDINNIYAGNTDNPLSPDVLVNNVGNNVGKNLSTPFYYTGLFVLFICIIITLVNASTPTVTIPAGIVYIVYSVLYSI